jgi:asparagine synthetase B (glutamine-hydrolysing)
MAPDTGVAHLGAFTIFGLTRDPDNFLRHKLPDRLGIVPRTIDFGSAGCFFLHTSCGDIAETQEAIALKLGFVRTPARSPLSAQQLLDQRVVVPQRIDPYAIRGNALVACFGKAEARFSVFKTLLSGLPLYYSVSDDGILCSDQLRCLVDLLDHLELDEATIPQHFLLLGTLGSQTYFRNVQRLRPGECLKWEEAGLRVRLVKDFRSFKADPTFGNIDARSPLIYQWLKDLVGAYVSEIQESGSDFGNLLSGGVDSSLTQLLINEHLRTVRPKSFSYRVHAPSFEPEVGYARQAQVAFNTEHTFIDILPKDYPGLLVRSTEILGQPVHMAMEPCKLAIAEFLANNPNSPHYYFNSQGADGLFGMSVARKIKWLELASRIPASVLVLSGAGKLLKPVTGRSQTLLKAATILKDPNHLVAPINTTGIGANFDFALHCFGEETVQRVFELRREEEVEYLDSHNYQEKVHRIDAFFTVDHLVSQTVAFFAANDKELVYPFFDEDALRISCAVRPEERYIRGFNRVKPILKDILEQRSSSPAPRLPKLGSSFNPDLHVWEDSGPLREMVRSIERPSFLSKSDFDRLLERPNHYFLWALLTFDIFDKRFLKR